MREISSGIYLGTLVTPRRNMMTGRMEKCAKLEETPPLPI
jgi:hypothetical protein